MIAQVATVACCCEWFPGFCYAAFKCTCMGNLSRSRALVITTCRNILLQLIQITTSEFKMMKISITYFYISQLNVMQTVKVE